MTWKNSICRNSVPKATNKFQEILGQNKKGMAVKIMTQLTFTGSMSTIETLEKGGVKYVQS